MNRAIRRLSIASLVLFVLLMVNVNYLQVFRVNTLAAEAGNARVFDRAVQELARRDHRGGRRVSPAARTR